MNFKMCIYLKIVSCMSFSLCSTNNGNHEAGISVSGFPVLDH